MIVQDTSRWTCVIEYLNDEDITGIFYKKSSKKQINQCLEFKNWYRRKIINSILNKKVW